MERTREKGKKWKWRRWKLKREEKSGRTQALLEKGVKRQTNTMRERNESLKIAKKRPTRVKMNTEGRQMGANT